MSTHQRCRCRHVVSVSGVHTSVQVFVGGGMEVMEDDWLYRSTERERERGGNERERKSRSESN